MQKCSSILSLSLIALLSNPSPSFAQQSRAMASGRTTTPIKHVVVIFDENISFDHYFGTYPVAENPPGEPNFQSSPDTPSVNGLTSTLLKNNPDAVAPGPDEGIQPGDMSMGAAAVEFLSMDEGEDEAV